VSDTKTRELPTRIGSHPQLHLAQLIETEQNVHRVSAGTYLPDLVTLRFDFGRCLLIQLTQNKTAVPENLHYTFSNDYSILRTWQGIIPGRRSTRINAEGFKPLRGPI
jgi:hypothetical protein